MSRWRAVSELLFAAVDGGVTRVEEMHAAIARRPLAVVAPGRSPLTPVRVAHDGITALVYGSIRAANAASRLVVGSALAALGTRLGGPASEWTDHALGALGGAIGDRLARDGSALTIAMELRHRGLPLAPERTSLTGAFPDATARISVFVHGLCATERGWRFYGHEPYGARLRNDLGYTPLDVRYNTGLHVSENGRRLADLLDAVVRSWPVAVEEVVLVGHSMGGLVARSACHYGRDADRAWVDAVRHVVCLGSPHGGAPLEKAANVGAWALAAFPETRPLATVVNGRSAGIKDLRFGYVLDDEWRDADPDALLENRSRDIPFLETATYHFVSATVTRDPRHPVARLVGDTLVRVPSAGGRPGWRRDRRSIGATSHLRLLNDPAVYEQLRAWLAEPPRPVTTPPGGPLAAG